MLTSEQCDAVKEVVQSVGRHLTSPTDAVEQIIKIVSQHVITDESHYEMLPELPAGQTYVLIRKPV